MNIERLKEMLDSIGNEVNLLHQAKIKRKVLQEFIDLLEDKQNMLNFFDEYSKKSIELEQQNKRYREALEFVNEELEHVLHSNKSLPVKMFYIENSKRKITETLEKSE